MKKNPKYFSIYPKQHQRISEFVTPHILTLFLVIVPSCLDYVGWMEGAFILRWLN